MTRQVQRIGSILLLNVHAVVSFYVWWMLVMHLKTQWLGSLVFMLLYWAGLDVICRGRFAKAGFAGISTKTMSYSLVMTVLVLVSVLLWLTWHGLIALLGCIALGVW